MKKFFKIYFLILIILFFSNLLFCQSLSVGEKVIYGGGANNPPQEKDIGNSLNGKVINIGGFSIEKPDGNFIAGAEAFKSKDFQKASSDFEMSMDYNEKDSKIYYKALILWAMSKKKMKDFQEAINRLEKYQNSLKNKDTKIKNLIEDFKKHL